jgi:hypothetical protein
MVAICRRGWVCGRWLHRLQQDAVARCFAADEGVTRHPQIGLRFVNVACFRLASVNVL